MAKNIPICVDDYEGWLETLEIMSSKEAMSDIRTARLELRCGNGYTFEHVFGKIPKKRGI